MTLTSDLFNSGQELGDLQPLSFQGTGYTGIARELPVAHNRWVGLFSACVPPVPAACGVAQKRCVHATK